MNTLKGFTLHELLCTLLIMSILTSTAIPAFTSLLHSLKTQNVYDTLFTLIQFSRSKAAFLGQEVILCPSADQTKCVNDWALPVMVFVDNNGNRKRDKDDSIERHTPLLPKNSSITLTWRASGTSRYLRYISDGSTGSQNGSFRICIKNGELEHAKKIIIYMSGRARKALRKEIKHTDCR